MKIFATLIFIISLTVFSFTQEPSTDTEKKDSDKTAEVEKKEETSQEEEIGDEKEEFDKAVNQITPLEKIKFLKKFIENFPESEKKNQALEIIVSARAEIADRKLSFNENEEGIKLFKLAVEEAPKPVSDKLFFGLLAKFPTNLFWRGQRKAAFEVAQMIEEKIDANPKYFLSLATFYLGVENPKQAKRLAEKALEVDSELASAHQTIGFANRLSFDLEKAEEAYQKAVELKPESIVFKNNLAEIKRALGKYDEAITLYNEIIEKDEENLAAKTGIILSLFDSDKTEEAESKLTESLEKKPANLILLVGVSYWYATQKNGEKAIEYAKKALDVEPRYTWTYIAMARGFMLKNEPLAAERTLLTAKQYGNFPTLEYELAAARFAAGFFREAAEDLAKSFTVEDDLVKTKLGKRVEKEAESFIELLSPERRASLFQVVAADNEETANRLKNLLDFTQKLEAKEIEEDEIIAIADKFIEGDDNMKFHRQMFVAEQLLKKKKALDKVLEITKEAVQGVDSALDVPNPSAAVMAEELYDSRKIAMARGRSIIVPNISYQTLLKIIRGRIEEMSGWALFEQEKNEEAITRLKIANSVYPKKSAWSRSNMWRLGTVLASEGKREEALEAYLESYRTDTQNSSKRIVIEALYAQIYGNLDGLEDRLNGKPPKSKSAETVSEKTEEDKKDEESDVKESDVSSTENEEKEKKSEEDSETVKPDEENVSENKEEKKDEEIKEDSEEKEEKTNDSEKEKPKATKCKISASPEIVSIGNNGGGLGVLIGFEEEKIDFQKIKAVPSSSEDVEVTFDPEISKLSDRAYFFIKSISTNEGMYSVTFETPCGKKEITVKVR